MKTCYYLGMSYTISSFPSSMKLIVSEVLSIIVRERIKIFLQKLCHFKDNLRKLKIEDLRIRIVSGFSYFSALDVFGEQLNKR